MLRDAGLKVFKMQKEQKAAEGRAGGARTFRRSGGHPRSRPVQLVVCVPPGTPAPQPGSGVAGPHRGKRGKTTGEKGKIKEKKK